jgi:hypothetical protein
MNNKVELIKTGPSRNDYRFVLNRTSKEGLPPLDTSRIILWPQSNTVTFLGGYNGAIASEDCINWEVVTIPEQTLSSWVSRVLIDVNRTKGWVLDLSYYSIHLTLDGGYTWQYVSTQPDMYYIADIVFFNDELLWLTAPNGPDGCVEHKSIDNGITWTTNPIDLPYLRRFVTDGNILCSFDYLFQNNVLYLDGIYKTKNGITGPIALPNYSDITTPTSFLRYYIKNFGFFLCLGPYMVKSTNGIDWVRCSFINLNGTTTPPNYFYCLAANDTFLLLLGNSNRFYKSFDGLTWTQFTPITPNGTYPSDSTEIACCNNRFIWYAYNNAISSVMLYSDDGENWNYVGIPGIPENTAYVRFYRPGIFKASV